MNRPQNEFIWVCTYSDAADLEARTESFFTARDAAGVSLDGNVAKMEVREVDMGPVA